MFALSVSLFFSLWLKNVTHFLIGGVCGGVYEQFTLTSVHHLPYLKPCLTICTVSCQLLHCYFFLAPSPLCYSCLFVKPLDIKYGHYRQRYAKCVVVIYPLHVQW